MNVFVFAYIHYLRSSNTCDSWQVPLFIPVVFCLTCFFMVFLSLYSDPVNTGIGFAISLTGIPAYYIFFYFSHRPKWLQGALGKSLLTKWNFTFNSTHGIRINGLVPSHFIWLTNQSTDRYTRVRVTVESLSSDFFSSEFRVELFQKMEKKDGKIILAKIKYRREFFLKSGLENGSPVFLCHLPSQGFCMLELMTRWWWNDFPLCPQILSTEPCKSSWWSFPQSINCAKIHHHLFGHFRIHINTKPNTNL